MSDWLSIPLKQTPKGDSGMRDLQNVPDVLSPAVEVRWDEARRNRAGAPNELAAAKRQGSVAGPQAPRDHGTCTFGALVVPFLTPLFGEGSPTKIDYRKKGYPYFNLSTGGPSTDTAAYIWNFGQDSVRKRQSGI